MLENATRLCGASFGADKSATRKEASVPLRSYNVPPAYGAYLVTQTPFQPHQQSGSAPLPEPTRCVHVADIRILPAYMEGDPSVVAISDLARGSTHLVVPMLKENELIGAITIYRAGSPTVH